jgi:hypothetical protein
VHGAVGSHHVLSRGIGVAVDGNGGDPESVERAQDAHGDLTSIGHEHAIKHAHIRKTP